MEPGSLAISVSIKVINAWLTDPHLARIKDSKINELTRKNEFRAIDSSNDATNSEMEDGPTEAANVWMLYWTSSEYTSSA